ncbi:hypothetical protein SAMN03159496_00266 [Rhizobium sp. NFR07]|uniref:hypothetical protein n=1 Tax=Rhizobium sp. NFR07 TaxID=1566262 RepID=UPI0008E8850A|nr:hypothetical protein [Rhizobium sp. NFR07]SFA77220.1 hypothetical protein SAMN03159496_00266 [Rhizobium sp. NFR07]
MAGNLERSTLRGAPLAEIAVLTMTAIGLGFVMEVMILAARFLASDSLPVLVFILAELWQQVAWSFLICSALTLASIIAERRLMLNMFLSMALTPVALIGTKAFQKGIGAILSLPSEADDAYIVTLFVGRALEYALLSMLLLVLRLRGDVQFHKFLSAGVLVAVMIGLPIGLRISDHSGTAAEQLGKVLNEVGWPILCACFVYGTAKLRLPAIQDTSKFR